MEKEGLESKLYSRGERIADSSTCRRCRSGTAVGMTGIGSIRFPVTTHPDQQSSGVWLAESAKSFLL